MNANKGAREARERDRPRHKGAKEQRAVDGGSAIERRAAEHKRAKEQRAVEWDGRKRTKGGRDTRAQRNKEL